MNPPKEKDPKRDKRKNSCARGKESRGTALAFSGDWKHWMTALKSTRKNKRENLF